MKKRWEGDVIIVEVGEAERKWTVEQTCMETTSDKICFI